MIGKILTDENRELLKTIYQYGGYIRISHLNLLYPELTHDSKLKKLEKLKSMRFLTSRRFKSDSKREPVTYQVTKSTCRLFDNPDSYFRKKHQVEYAYRALVKNHFCLENHSIKELLIADHEDRFKLLKSNNFNEELYPRKHNKQESFIHIEELLIDFTNNQGKEISNNGVAIYNDSVKRTVIVYIDKYYVAVKKQLITIINKYLDMILSGGDCNVDFLIVVDDVNRKNLYDKEIEKFLIKNVFRDKISDSIIKLYANYLEKYYESLSNFTAMDKLHIDHKSGILKNELLNKYANIKLDKLDNSMMEIKNFVLLKDSNYIVEKVKTLIKEAGSIDNSREKVEDFFKNIFILEANNYISFSDGERKKKFDIKTYLIKQKIYD